MAIKHELDPTSPDTAPPSTPKKQKKPATANTPATPSPAKSGWTPESRETLIERLLTIGWQYAKLDDLVQETRLSKKQLSDAMCKGRNNLRAKVIEFAKTAAATGSTKR